MRVGRSRLGRLLALTMAAVALPLVLKAILIRDQHSVNDPLPQETRSKEEYLADLIAQGKELPFETHSPPAKNKTRRKPKDTNSSMHQEVIKKTHSKVLLVAYYRGGSSFLGELFANNPEAFYVFEPLFGIQPTRLERKEIDNLHLGHVVDASHLVMSNETVRPLPVKFVQNRYDQTAKIFDCHISSMDPRILGSVMFRSATHMPHFKAFRTCISNKSRTDCPITLDQTCTKAPLVAVKTIRVPMYGVPAIIEKIPDLKVIHYMRDPRGTLLSRKRWDKSVTRNLGRTSKDLCLQMLDNYRTFQRLKSVHPEKYLLVRYEDLALEPERVTKEIYQFVNGESPPQEVTRWIDINTRQNTKDVFGTRRNSTETAYSWKTKWSEQQIEDMTHSCEEELKLMGY